LGETRITLRQIMQMQTGDVIPIGISETIHAAVDNVPVIECRYGVQNGRYALRIERFLAQEDTHSAAAKH
jgi:flagellar motor switch protein FliM